MANEGDAERGAELLQIYISGGAYEHFSFSNLFLSQFFPRFQ